MDEHNGVLNFKISTNSSIVGSLNYILSILSTGHHAAHRGTNLSSSTIESINGGLHGSGGTRLLLIKHLLGSAPPCSETCLLISDDGLCDWFQSVYNHL